MGDMNYRIDPYTHGLAQLPPDGKPPKSGSPEHGAIGTRIRELVVNKDFEELLKHDELRHEMREGRVLATFKEGNEGGREWVPFLKFGIHCPPPTFSLRLTAAE